MKAFICIGVLIILYLLFALFTFGAACGEINALARKCAETQGKYDFCVQKISYEVKQ